MTTIKIKPNTRLKDILIEKEKKRLLKRASEAKSLANLLATLPKVDPSAIEPAVSALMDAADEYRASQPVVDPKGRRSKLNLAEARASLLSLHQAICTADTVLSDLPLNAITALISANDSPFAELRPNFSKLLLTIETARYLLLAAPDKVPDHHRAVLAYEVAVVFIDILKKAPSSARANQLKENNPRGGAAYDRVLRATLKAAGITNYDSGPLIVAGLRLLRDPVLPTRN